jgi:hypothetical protein
MPGESGDMVRIVLAGGCVAFGVVARSERWGSGHAILRKDQLRIPRLICKGTPNWYSRPFAFVGMLTVSPSSSSEL